MHTLSFENVRKDFHETRAINNISFTIDQGEFAALAGPSGSGKTTILNLASGLDEPSSGRITLLGFDLSLLSHRDRVNIRRDSVGFVFQSYNLLPVLTAIENVEYPLALRGIPSRQRRKVALELLESVGLGHLSRRRPHQLSGGQQQRVAVARALAIKPKIIFADEPTANLDSQSAEHLLALFGELNRSQKITFLFSSHDPRVLKSAKRILFVQDGSIHDQSNIFSRNHDALRAPDSVSQRVVERFKLGPPGVH